MTGDPTRDREATLRDHVAREIFIQHGLAAGWGKRDLIEQAWDKPAWTPQQRRRWTDTADAVLTVIVERGGEKHPAIVAELDEANFQRDDLRAELLRTATERDDARAEIIDLRALFDLQQTRMVEATEAWRAESPAERENVLPDLGDLLVWLMSRAEGAEAGREVERTGLRNAMDRISKAIEHSAHQTGVTSFATAKAWRRQLDILNGPKDTP